MADRNQLAQEKAGLISQINEIVADHKAKQEQITKEAQEKAKPLEERVVEINNQILTSVDQEAGLGEACPA
tara:strand:+ start:2603 stop:2815 length:213 start_codon:yes stop_codon:yes gene_type:complete